MATKKTPFDGLVRFRKTTEEAAGRAVAEAHELVEQARGRVGELEARLREHAAMVITDASLLATHEAAQARLRHEVHAAHEALTKAQQAHRGAQGRLLKAAQERRAADRLVERNLEERDEQRRRRDRREEDEIAQRSGEGLPEP